MFNFFIFCCNSNSILIATENKINYASKLNVSQNIAYAYVTNALTNSISSCRVNLDGSLNNCVKAANISFGPVSISFDSFNNAYLPNASANFLTYYGASYNGLLPLCCSTNGPTIDGPISAIFYNGFAYINSLKNNSVVYCPQHLVIVKQQGMGFILHLIWQLIITFFI